MDDNQSDIFNFSSMKTIKTAFILASFLLVSLFCSTALPSWTRDNKIDSGKIMINTGELKAVNY